MQDLVVEIRKDTAEVHKRLEHSPVTSRLLHPNATTRDLEHYLNCFLLLHHLSEPVIYPEVEKIIPDIGENRRFKDLEKDVSELGFSPQFILDSFLSPPISPVFKGVETLGALYVLEGSRLGGRMIYKHLASRLNDELPDNYLNKPSFVAWSVILNELNKVSPEDQQKVKQAAKRMFIFVEHVLSYYTKNKL